MYAQNYTYSELHISYATLRHAACNAFVKYHIQTTNKTTTKFHLSPKRRIHRESKNNPTIIYEIEIYKLNKASSEAVDRGTRNWVRLQRASPCVQKHYSSFWSKTEKRSMSRPKYMTDIMQKHIQ